MQSVSERLTIECALLLGFLLGSHPEADGTDSEVRESQERERERETYARWSCMSEREWRLSSEREWRLSLPIACIYYYKTCSLLQNAWIRMCSLLQNASITIENVFSCQSVLFLGTSWVTTAILRAFTHGPCFNLYGKRTHSIVREHILR